MAYQFTGTKKIVAMARDLTFTRHGKQVRKYTGEPYFVHLSQVAGLVASVTSLQTMIAAAYLHDFVEDHEFTQGTHNEVRKVFGSEVAELVYQLTDQYTDPRLGNREARKASEAMRLACTDSWVQTIKVADLISNTQSIVVGAPAGFARLYLKEKQHLLDMLTKAEPWLHAMARATVRQGLDKLDAVA